MPWAFVSLAAVLLAGCINTKPVQDTTRYFVLAATAGPLTNAPVKAADLTVGLDPVSVPGYLLDDRLLIRKSDTELGHLDWCRWPERLDKALQRVLAQNLENALPGGKVFPAPWRREQVKIELVVAFAECEFTEQGRVRVQARWRFGRPGAPEEHKTGQARIEKEGSAPAQNPAEAVAKLNEALAGLSQLIARDLVK